MKKTKLFLLASILLITNSFSIAQFSIIEGKEKPYEKNGEKIIGGDEYGIYALRISNKGTRFHILVEKYKTDDCGFEFEKEIESEKIQKELNSTSSVYNVSAFLANNKVFVFFEAFDKKHNEQKLFLQTVSSAGNLSEVFEIANLNNGTAANSLYSNFIIGFTKSKDHFWVCPIASIPYILTKDIEGKISISLYKSTDFQKKFTKDFNAEVFTKDFSSLSKLTVLDNGDIFINYVKPLTKGYSVGVIIIENNSPTPKLIELDILKYQRLISYTYKNLKNNEILIAALIADTSKIRNVDDMNNCKLLTAKYEMNTYSKIYENEIKINEHLPVKLEKLEKNFSNYDFLEITEMEDGVIISTEYQNILLGTPPSFWGYGNTSCLDLLLFKYSQNGELVFGKNIPKNNTKIFLYSYDPIGKYDLFVINNKLKIVFEENSANANKNLKVSSINYLKYTKKDITNVVMVTIDNHGEVSKEKIYENKFNMAKFDITKPFNGKESWRIVYFENKKANLDKLGLLKIQ